MYELIKNNKPSGQNLKEINGLIKLMKSDYNELVPHITPQEFFNERCNEKLKKFLKEARIFHES